MATTPAQRRLAEALAELKAFQDAGQSVVRTEDLRRVSREALLKQGFLQPIVPGWYMPSQPGLREGDTTPWVASAREFVQRYATHRFGDNWCVDSDYSIKLHTGSNLIPSQVIIHAPKGNNNRLDLPGKHSLFVYKTREPLPGEHIEVVQGLRSFTLPYALTRIPEAFFRTSKQDALLALRSLPDASDLNRILLTSGQPTAAGRLAGALRACGRSALADDILSTVRTAGYRVEEANPFQGPVVQGGHSRPLSPYVDRVHLMWATMREGVIGAFAASNSTRLPKTKSQIDAAMRTIEEQYVTDAYHSLSIEGYRVTEELIRRVASGEWNPDHELSDRELRNAMAAHGYWRAHNAVKGTIRRFFEDATSNVGDLVRRDHATWYREMFSPSIDAGILKPSDLAGYRNDQVYIRTARHVPPPKEAVRDAMPGFFDLLRDEEHPAVRIALGHFVFVFIHPYMDGNGRMARFLMNAMLCTAGYPWTVIKLDQRKRYFHALDQASADGNIRPFAEFISECVAASSSRPETVRQPTASKTRRARPS